MDVDYSTDDGNSWDNVAVNYRAHIDSISLQVTKGAGSSLKFRVIRSGTVNRGVTYYSHTLAVTQGTDAVAPTKHPYTYALSNNYPNPFNPSPTRAIAKE